jgi:ketosteroid isomerase-like protein
MPEDVVIRQQLDAWAAAVRARDLEGVTRDHAAEIRLFDVVPPLQSRGLEAYRASWDMQFFPWMGSDGRFELGDVAVTVGDRVAFATGIIDCAGYERGTRVEFRLRLTVCFEKRDGRWTVVHEHHSEPIAPA